MFTEPKIVSSNDLSKRSYVTFYLDDIRLREYNGNNIGQKIIPNRAVTLAERDALLRRLQYELHKALESGNYPTTKCKNGHLGKAQSSVDVMSSPELELGKPNARAILEKALQWKLAASISKKYKRNLRDIHAQLTSFLSASELEDSLVNIPTIRLDHFLSQFSSSGTYYMNKRRDLGVLFNVAGKMLQESMVSVKATERRKIKARLHNPYEKDQLKPILNFLKANFPNLHICCLLTYSTWLRPHEEIRLLTIADFNKDISEIRLSGDDNKGGKVRTVFVPDYVREVLSNRLLGLNRDDNIFSCTREPYNEYYFSLQWKRAWKKMSELKLVYQNQTIYSFRHTASVQIYRRTKDVYLLQKLLGHSSIVVTLRYLRSLGELSTDDLKAAAPLLE